MDSYRNMRFARNPYIRKHLLTLKTLVINGSHKTMFLLYSTESLGKSSNDSTEFWNIIQKTNKTSHFSHYRNVCFVIKPQIKMDSLEREGEREREREREERPKSSQERPRAAKSDPRAAQEQPREAQKRPKAPQERPKSSWEVTIRFFWL